MKDYSEFIMEKEGFITSIKPIIETKTIAIMTSKSQKGKPHIYELTKENIKKYYGRLEKQYNLLIENKNSILKKLQEKRNKTNKKIAVAGISASAALIITGLLLPEITLLFVLGLIPGPVTLASIIAANQKFTSDFEDMIKTYEYFITHKEEIEKLSKTDPNVISNITSETTKEFKKSKQLQQENLTEEEITLQLIDRIPLKDLKIISENYRISKALETEPYFCEPKTEEEQPITRKKQK